jgi:predicted Zn-dependent protease with MMP-like domain
MNESPLEPGWALLDRGDPEAAFAHVERALAEHPSDPAVLLEAARLLIELSDGEDHALLARAADEAERGVKLADKAGDDDELGLELLFTQARACIDLGDCLRALSCLDEALRRDPSWWDAACERAVALFELCRFDEAKAAFQALTTDAPDEPWPLHYLGLLAERRGEIEESERLLRRAREIAPEELPEPVKISEEAFDAALGEALASLPDEIRQHLKDAPIAVEAVPDEEDLLAEDPPLSPASLGLFRGTPIGARSVTSAADHVPISITLYQRNLERFARTREELIEQIRITVLHEVGHLVGWDDDELRARGLG